MRTRMVRTRRRGGSMKWAVVLLFAAMAVYVRVSLPMLMDMRGNEPDPTVGERVTREVAIEAIDIHLICFGEWGTQSAAQMEAGRYVPRGAAGYVMQEGERFCVIGAMYEDAAQAERVCTQLGAAEGLSCSVKRNRAAEVRMRMTAREGQIEAFVQGEKTMRQTWRALGALSLALDRGEANVQQAHAVLDGHLEKMRSARKALKDAGGTEQEIFVSLDVLLDALTSDLEEMTEERGRMALSAKLKYCGIDAALRQAVWMNGM